MLKFEVARAVESYPGGGHDRVEIFELEGACILAVADGMGGRSGAAEAAEGWVGVVRDCLNGSVHRWSDSGFWMDLMARADRTMAEGGAGRADRAARAGETTAVVVAVTSAGFAGASVGDSGAILWTADREIELTRGQVRKPGVGSGMAVVVPFSHKLVEGTLVVATDGLLKYAARGAIRQRALQGEVGEAARGLVELVRLPRGGLQDDVGVGVCRVEVG